MTISAKYPAFFIIPVLAVGVVTMIASFSRRTDNLTSAPTTLTQQTVASTASPPVTPVAVTVPRKNRVSSDGSTPIASTAITPRSLSFVQDGLHNCGTVAMLISWASAYPREAARLVRRQANGSYLVKAAGQATVVVTAANLASANKAGVVLAPRDDRWSEIVLTAFTIRQSGNPIPNFKTIEWLYAGDIGDFLTGRQCAVFDIKPEMTDASGRLKVGAPVTPVELEKQLKKYQGNPTVAYTNRRIHIWSVLGYDARRKLVRMRNPRHRQSLSMPLSTFRQKFQMIVRLT